MTRDDIIKLAEKAGMGYSEGPYGWTTYDDPDCLYPECVRTENLERFANLVAAAERERLEATAWGASKRWIDAAVAAEREECAKACESFNSEPVSHATVAAAIRARGEK